MDCNKDTKEDGPRQDPGDLAFAIPLHKVTERSYHEQNTIRKPPPTVEQNEWTMVRDNTIISASISSSGGDTHDRKLPSRSMKGYNGASSEKRDHVVSGSLNSNSSSGDDRGSSDRGSSDWGSNERGTDSKQESGGTATSPHAFHHQFNLENRQIHDLSAIAHQSDVKQVNTDSVSDPDQRNVRIQSCHTQNSIEGHEMRVTKDQEKATFFFQKNSSMKDNEEHNSKNPSSDYGSDGGYEGSASSNDVGGSNSSASDSVSSNEGLQESKPSRLNQKRYETAKSSSMYASSSSEIADFSSEMSDSGESNSTGQRGFSKSSERINPSSYLIVDSTSDNSDNVSDTSTSIKKRRLNSATKTVGVGERFERYLSVPVSASSLKVAKRRKKSFRKDHDGSANNLKESTTIGSKTSGLSPEFLKALRKEDLKCNIPSSWDFIERSMLNKSTSLAELQQNFDSAIKRYIDSNPSSGLPSSSIPSSKSSSSTECRTSEHYHATPLYNVGVDIMAKILTYLAPSEANRVLSCPLSKTFRATFSLPQDVWKILCFSKPFYATIDEKCSESGDDSVSSYPMCKNFALRHVLGRYRLLYSSFVRCVNYLDAIKNELNGRTMNKRIDANVKPPFSGNSSLRSFFAAAGDVKRNGTTLRYGHSSLTSKLLGPNFQSGIAGSVKLPISCAVYTIVNWMVAFADVPGIQTICLDVLPILLEDDQQRSTAQNAGLTDLVIRAMVLFPNHADLHTSAFHTLVLLARPIGGKEGMIFYNAMANASGIFNVGSSKGNSGLVIMMDSMKRFSSHEKLQAMSCWSMVNIALIQAQKVALVKLGGVSAVGNAMMQHPSSPDVQFRALFALINLVIPSENLPENSLEVETIRKDLDGVHENSEIQMLDRSVEYITNLVLQAMKNFCSNTAILNRACLVLHNLSLNTRYHKVLLWTPNCYQMIEWCIENYKHDKILQQSARGTLRRLQMTLSDNEILRSQFTETIRAQQQSSVDNVVFQRVAIPGPSGHLDAGNQSIS